MRRKLCTNCGAPKPSAVRNAVGVRAVSESENVQDQRGRPDDLGGIGGSGGMTNNVGRNMSPHSVAIGGSLNEMYNRGGRVGLSHHESPGMGSSSGTVPSSSTYHNAFRPIESTTTNHQVHPLSMRRPGDDIPLPTTLGRGGHSGASEGFGAPQQSRRMSNAVLADPLVNPSQLPVHNLSSNSYVFSQKMFNFVGERHGGNGNEQYSLPSVHNSFGMHTSHLHHGGGGIMNEANIQRQRHQQIRGGGGELHEMSHGGGMASFHDGSGHDGGVVANAMGSSLHLSGRGGIGGGVGSGHGRYVGQSGMRCGDQVGRQGGVGGVFGESVMDSGDTHQMFASGGGQSLFAIGGTGMMRQAMGGGGGGGLPPAIHLHHERYDEGGGGGSEGGLMGGGRGYIGFEQHHKEAGGRIGDERFSGTNGGSGLHHHGGGEVGGLEGAGSGGGHVGLDSGRRDDSRTNANFTRLEGDKSSMTGQTVNSLEGSTHVEDGGRQSDEGRFAIGSILMHDKNAAAEQ